MQIAWMGNYVALFAEHVNYAEHVNKKFCLEVNFWQ